MKKEKLIKKNKTDYPISHDRDIDTLIDSKFIPITSADEIDIIEIGTQVHKDLLRNVLLAKWQIGKENKQVKNERQFALEEYKHAKHAFDFLKGDLNVNHKEKKACEFNAKEYTDRVLDEVNFMSIMNRNTGDNFMMQGIFGSRVSSHEEDNTIDGTIQKKINSVTNNEN